MLFSLRRKNVALVVSKAADRLRRLCRPWPAVVAVSVAPADTIR